MNFCLSCVCLLMKLHWSAEIDVYIKGWQDDTCSIAVLLQNVQDDTCSSAECFLWQHLICVLYISITILLFLHTDFSVIIADYRSIVLKLVIKLSCKLSQCQSEVFMQIKPVSDVTILMCFTEMTLICSDQNHTVQWDFLTLFIATVLTSNFACW